MIFIKAKKNLALAITILTLPIMIFQLANKKLLMSSKILVLAEI